jgi:hypothetical protein
MKSVEVLEAPRRHSAQSRVLMQLAATLVLVVVLMGYFLRFYQGGWPPGHPWSGLCFVSLALAQLLDVQEHSWSRVAVYGSNLAVAVPWLVASLQS